MTQPASHTARTLPTRPRSGALKVWASFSLREQILLAVMATLAVLIGGYYGVADPLARYHSAAETRLIAAQEEAALIASLKTRWATAGLENTAKEQPAQAANTPAANPRAVLTEAAKDLGITVNRLQPDGNGGVNVWVENIETPQFFALMERLQNGAGLTVKAANLQRPSADAPVQAQFLITAKTQGQQ